MSRVLIIHSTVKHYRTPFFDALHAALEQDGVELRLVFGQPTVTECLKSDTFTFDRSWGIPVKNHWYFKERYLFQPVWDSVKWADLVIVEQANKHLINYPLLLLRRLIGKKVAFWGHGRNRQASQKNLGERFKRLLLTAPDWWFAYTRGVKEYLVEQGVHPGIITTVQNSVDTASFCRDLAVVSSEALQGLRVRHKLGQAAIIGLYCGSLYSEKQIEFLLDAARRIRARVPSFHLFILGGGELAALVERSAAQADWINFVGPQFGVEKAAYFRLASFFLNPGMIGLSILDAFCAGLPMLTTDYFGHSPEIDYLKPGVNGLRSVFEPEAFAAMVAELCADLALLASLRQGASLSGARYTLEAMVTNFCNGIHRCLAS
jgi:glycosyltransferase involved in cell wall biosynthesis